MKVALAQINTTVGDLAGNEAKILAGYQRAVEAGVDLVMFPELTITGYPPRDLLHKKRFIAENLEVLNRLAAVSGKVGMLVGYVTENKTRPGKELSNCVALLQNGKIVESRIKTLLPTYDVFDEDRYFEPANENQPVEFNGTKLGLTICEDIWNDEDFWPERRYRHNPPMELAGAGAGILFNVSASPWSLGKEETRYNMLRSMAIKSKRPVVFCNQIGGNDELIFDGGSLAFNAEGTLIGRGDMFAEDFFVVDTESSVEVPRMEWSAEEFIYKALVLGLRDYLHKCGFKSAVLGLSGGIDSALTAVIAVDALGKEHVRGVSLPSQYSSQGSLDDAQILAERLGIRYDVVPIQPEFEAVKKQLASVFTGLKEDTTEENIQARLRGVTLMAMSNKFGALLLTTGNKSELAVGYCTLYGDMCGGLAVISDVPKTMVYQISKWINREQEIIPRDTITKPPSAELRPNQTDQDSLPPYEVLDAILDAYVVQGKGMREIIALGFEEPTVKRVIRLIDFNEYKRRQAAPGLKVTSKAFGVGRRIPIAQKYQIT
ncbi:NAD+ synthase [Pedosphaera parvula]|uniref:Glutamine-dependent NAD(+) synthetase n=1 Tax=Pedosphaera parvula (strain Ellin514) TaxID=320771 RepID=B9XD88_PEDPL|nr:NAD+ synthase [Pedosphaera parvula]EEF62034.1 NAD+ synthetase [Pedosphaera parvula Ellin514]